MADLSSREVLALLPPHGYTIPGLIATRAAARPEQDALVYEGRTWSWRALEQDVGRLAAWFAARGVGRGDRVAIVASNSAAFVLTFLALGRLGAILVTVNPDVSAPDVADIHARVAPRMTLHGGSGSARAAEALALHPLPAHDVERVLADAIAADAAAPPADARPDDTCLIMFTSGTTGRPKGVMHGQRTFALAGECFVERMRIQPDERLLAVMPLFHINAMFYSVGGTCAAGATLIVAPRFSASTFWTLAAATRATEVNLIMAATSILLRRPREEYAPDHRLRKTYAPPVNREIAETLARDYRHPGRARGLRHDRDSRRHQPGLRCRAGLRRARPALAAPGRSSDRRGAGRRRVASRRGRRRAGRDAGEDADHHAGLLRRRRADGRRLRRRVVPHRRPRAPRRGPECSFSRRA